MRILRAYNVRLAETSDPDMPMLADIRDYLEPFGIDAEAAIPLGLISTLDSAVYSAGQIRDRFSPDGWLALRDLSKTIHQFAEDVAPGDDATRAMTVILRKLAGFSGLVHENMYRFTGWRFLEIGRRLERGIQIARSLAWLTREDAPDGALDMMLEIGDSVMTHRRHYTVSAGRRSAGRPAGARSAQPALGAVPARPAAGGDRPAARQRHRRASVAGGQGGAAAAHRRWRSRAAADLTPEALDALGQRHRRPLRPASRQGVFRVSSCTTTSASICTTTTPRAAGGGRHQVRVMPLTIPGVQRVIAVVAGLHAEPAERSDFTDFFGNGVTAIAFRDVHETLDIRMSARVAVSRPEPGFDVSPDIARLQAGARRALVAGAGFAASFPEPPATMPARGRDHRLCARQPVGRRLR